MPKFSIVVPVYNTEKYLPKCIESILAQTQPDFELILIDDGSPDNSGRICEDYARKDSRIRVFHKVNEGASATRNYGFDHAFGKFVYFMDSDDWIEPDLLEAVADSIEKDHPEMIFFFQSDPRKFGVQSYEFHNPPTEACRFRFLRNNTAGPWQKIFNSDFLRRTGIRWNRNLDIAEDQELHFKIMTQVKSFSVIPRSLYHYRIDNLSSSTKVSTFKKRFGIFDCHESVLGFYQEKGISWKYRNILFEKMLEQEVPLYWRLPDENLREEWKKQVTKLWNKTGSIEFLRRYSQTASRLKDRTYAQYLLYFVFNSPKTRTQDLFCIGAGTFFKFIFFLRAHARIFMRALRKFISRKDK